LRRQKKHPPGHNAVGKFAFSSGISAPAHARALVLPKANCPWPCPPCLARPDLLQSNSDLSDLPTAGLKAASPIRLGREERKRERKKEEEFVACLLKTTEPEIIHTQAKQSKDSDSMAPHRRTPQQASMPVWVAVDWMAVWLVHSPFSSWFDLSHHFLNCMYSVQ
jgi:hypothetical protein